MEVGELAWRAVLFCGQGREESRVKELRWLQDSSVLTVFWKAPGTYAVVCLSLHSPPLMALPDISISDSQTGAAVAKWPTVLRRLISSK